MPRKAVTPRAIPKARYDLIPANALHQVALAYAYGEEKHKANPKEKGRSWRGEFAAAMRHSWAFVRGEYYDKETKLCHLAHAAARVLILLEFFITETGTDDLTPKPRKEKTMRRRLFSGIRVLMGTALAFVMLIAAMLFTHPVRAETVGEAEVSTVYVVSMTTSVGGLVVNRAVLEYPDRKACIVAMTLMAIKAGSAARPYCVPALRDEMGELTALDIPPAPNARDSPVGTGGAPI